MPPPAHSRSCGPVATGRVRLRPKAPRFPFGWMLPSGIGAARGADKSAPESLGSTPKRRTRWPTGAVPLRVPRNAPKRTLVDPSTHARKRVPIAGAYPVHSSHYLLPGMTASDLERRLPCAPQGPEGPNPLAFVRRLG
jgi:hypothetical protein